MRRTVLFFLLISSFILPQALRAEEIPLTLEEAVAIALRDNRDLLLKAEEVKKAKLKINEARASLYPSLTFTGSWKDTRDLYEKKDSEQISTQLTLKQYIYRGGKTINTIKLNQKNVEVAQAVLDKTKLDTLLDVQKAFYLFLLSAEYADLNKNILDNTVAHLEYVQARFRSGQASESEILSIKESLSTVDQAYVESLSQAESAEALLRNLLYLDDSVKIKPQGNFVYQPKEVAYDEAFLQAMRSRPEIRQYAAQEDADRRSIEIAKADNRPSIYASWDYYSSSTQGAVTPVNSWQDYNVIGITFSWPIFDGWATKAKVEQAIVDLKETQLTKQKLVRDIALELKNAYLDLKNAISQIKTADSDIVLYKDGLNTIEKRYQQGMVSRLEQEDANLKYQISLFNMKQAIYDYIVARASFDRATGGI